MKQLISILIILVFAVTAFAQDNGQNDPSTDPTANACYDGGSMAGKCNEDMDGDGILSQYEIDWAWECGWYAIRHETGIFTDNDIPPRCAEAVNVPVHYNDNCYTNGEGSSIAYIGPENTRGNILFFSNQDCSGESYLNPNIFIVFAANETEAVELCELQGNVVYTELLRHLHYNTPANVYGCVAN